VVAVALGELDGFSGSLAEVVELRASCFAASDGLYVEDVWGMEREDSLDSLVADDSSDGEVLVDSAAFACDDGAGEYLGADLVAFGYAAVDVNNIAYLEVRDILLEAFAFNGIQHFSFHWYISYVWSGQEPPDKYIVRPKNRRLYFVSRFGLMIMISAILQKPCL
jgi:hypothetical protein